MELKKFIAHGTAIVAIAGFALAPVSAQAQSSHRQQQKNQWRNIAIGSGALGLLGLLKGDSTLTFVGGAGALYSAYRYEQDRKSQRREDQARARLFSMRSFSQGGHRYVRHTKYKNGKKYYYFTRS
jgi:hypothetical protein